MDTFPLSDSLPRCAFNWATCRYCAGFVDDAGLELTLFRCEPLAMAQGIEAVLRNGGLSGMLLT